MTHARSTGHLVLGIGLLVAACSSARTDGKGVPVAKALPPPGPQPDFGAIAQQDDPPPPISGGTLAIDPKTGIAVAADSDRDRVYVVDLDARTVRYTIPLAKHAEPGRVALDGHNRAHVALRGTAELATIELATGTLSVRSACVAPRGVAYDGPTDTVYVACASGDLLVLPAGGGPALKRLGLGRDLRDVVLAGGRVYVTRFRTAHLLEIDPQGTGAGLIAADAPVGGESNLAWRATAPPPSPDASDGPPAPVIVAQDPSPVPVHTTPGGYGSGGAPEATRCSGAVGIVSTRVFVTGNTHGSVRLPTAVLPVDVATNGRELAVVAAGNAHTKSLPQLFVLQKEQLRGTQDCTTTIEGTVSGQAVAAAFDHRDELVVQSREPAELYIMSADRRRPMKTITLATDSREDTGHAIFHSNAGGNIACASCHAEGGDDGRAWDFVEMGPRRTPSLLGTTKNTEPYHWDGDMKDLGMLVDHVFVERMSGPKMDKAHVDVLGNFLFKLPPPFKLRLEKDVAPRGKQLFEERCTACHAGSAMTNNRTVDVGTGGAFQVPSLVGVGWRAPFLHSGCAKTLFDRFDPSCGGAAHGDTRDLTKDQVADIVAFLETL
jgi:mono/diheme cytochrome c family protein/DNA-binding beta-propeller fold protein YncE